MADATGKYSEPWVALAQRSKQGGRSVWMGDERQEAGLVGVQVLRLRTHRRTPAKKR
jgi:hypothetical protein